MPKQETVQIPAEIEKEVTLLRGFRDLMAERVGYALGARALGQTMSKETVDQRDVVTKTSKSLKKALKQLIATPTKENSETVQTIQNDLTEAREANSEARKPHMEKITPLKKAVRYIDVVAVPDSLKELGATVTPRFSLSEWAKGAIAK